MASHVIVADGDETNHGVIGYLRSRRTALTEAEYCNVLGISRKKAQRDRTIGAGPRFIKDQHGIRYLPEDVADFLEQHRRSSTIEDRRWR